MNGDVHHYGVTVSDLDESVAFYRDALGMTEAERAHFDDDAFARFVGLEAEGVDVDIAFLDGGGCLVELLEYEHPPGGDANEGVSNNDVGAAHVCFDVDDLEATYDDLSDSGDAEFVNPPQTLENGAKVAYLYDPDDNVVELLEE